MGRWMLVGLPGPERNLSAALDGTDTFSSESGNSCPSCHVTHRSDGSVQHCHIAVTPALVVPGEPRVVPLVKRKKVCPVFRI